MTPDRCSSQWRWCHFSWRRHNFPPGCHCFRDTDIPDRNDDQISNDSLQQTFLLHARLNYLSLCASVILPLIAFALIIFFSKWSLFHVFAAGSQNAGVWDSHFWHGDWKVQSRVKLAVAWRICTVFNKRFFLVSIFSISGFLLYFTSSWQMFVSSLFSIWNQKLSVYNHIL